MRGKPSRLGVLLEYPSPFAISACRIWRRSALWKWVDLLSTSSAPSSSTNGEPQQPQKVKTTSKLKTVPIGLPGFQGSERPAFADIHILCYVFQHIPWSPSVELHLRRRNFGLTTAQVILVLDQLKGSLKHSLNFFIWADQQRGHNHTAECFEILKGIMNSHVNKLYQLLKDMEQNSRFISLDVLNVVMEVFVEMNMVHLALEVFRTITKFGSRPDEASYNLMLQALLDAGCIDVVMEVFEQMKKDKLCPPGDATFSLIFLALGKFAKIADARKLLESRNFGNKVSPVDAYNQLLRGLCEGRWMDYGEEILIEMYEQGFEPSVNAYTSLITGYANAARLTEAYQYYADAVKDKLITPSMDLLTVLTKGFCKLKDAETSQKLLIEMLNAGLSPDVSLCVLVIQCATEQGQWQEDSSLLRSLKDTFLQKDAKLYDLIIISCARAGHIEALLSLLHQKVGNEQMNVGSDTAIFSILVLKLVELNQPDHWQKFFAIFKVLENDLQEMLFMMLLEVLSKDEFVAKNIMALMAEGGLL